MVDLQSPLNLMSDGLLSPGRHGHDLDICWSDVFGQPPASAEASRCCSLDAEDPPALCQNWQPVDSCQKEGPSEGPCAALLQSLDEYLASVEFPEQSTEQQPSLYSDSHAQPGGNHSWMHSNEHDGLLSLLFQKDSQPIPSGMLPLLPQKDGEPVSYGSAADEALLQAAAALGPCKQASAEQQARSSEAECTEGVPLAGIHTLDGCAEEVSLGSASHMLEDIFMQAASSDSSADCFSAEPGQQPFGAVSSALQEAPPSLAIPGRKRGRPRRYDTTLPLGDLNARMAGSCDTINGTEVGMRKRGAKPKYKFLTAEEAVAHRQERNRSTAKATHEKKKARENALKAELDLRQSEHDALQRLLNYVQQPNADKEMVRRLLLGEEGAEGSICDAMEFVLITDAV